jgi:hypothetical protein
VPKHSQGHIPGQSSVGRNKGAPIHWPGLRQLPPPHSCQDRPPLLAWLLVCSPELWPPSAPQFLKQQALSPQPPRTSKLLTPSLSPAGSAAETQSLSLSPQANDGRGSTSEHPQPGQQRLYHLFPQQPEHEGPSFLVGMGRKVGFWATLSSLA